MLRPGLVKKPARTRSSRCDEVAMGADARPSGPLPDGARRRLHSARDRRTAAVASPSPRHIATATSGRRRRDGCGPALARCSRSSSATPRTSPGSTPCWATATTATTSSIGFRAVDELLAELPAETPPGDLLRAVGHRLVAAVGGASGPLYGTALHRGRRSSPATPRSWTARPSRRCSVRPPPASPGAAAARPGDKTILDTLAPAAEAFERELSTAERGPGAAWRSAVRAGAHGMRSTRDLIARRGLAMRLGERSVGHLDPGAVSCLLLLRAAGRPVNPRTEREALLAADRRAGARESARIRGGPARGGRPVRPVPAQPAPRLGRDASAGPWPRAVPVRRGRPVGRSRGRRAAGSVGAPMATGWTASAARRAAGEPRGGRALGALR